MGSSSSKDGKTFIDKRREDKEKVGRVRKMLQLPESRKKVIKVGGISFAADNIKIRKK